MGQVGAAMTNPNTMAQSPSGFNGAEWGTRIAGKGLQGLAGGAQNYLGQQQQIQNRGGGQMMQPAQGAAPVDASYFTPQGPGTGDPNGMPRKTSMPNFYGFGS